MSSTRKTSWIPSWWQLSCNSFLRISPRPAALPKRCTKDQILRETQRRKGKRSGKPTRGEAEEQHLGCNPVEILTQDRRLSDHDERESKVKRIKEKRSERKNKRKIIKKTRRPEEELKRREKEKKGKGWVQ